MTLYAQEKKGKMKKDLIGFCGLYCGACDNYLAFKKDNEHLLENEKFKTIELQELSCNGCHSEKLTEHCGKCLLRKCAIDKGIDSCGYCPKYPCDELKKFKNDGHKWQGAKHRKDTLVNINYLLENDLENWIIRQENRWKCECGLSYSYYEKNCNNCGKRLNSYAG